MKSNLTLKQQKLVRTPEFKAWFGDWENDPENSSKVVDENGEPLVVFHGSPAGETTNFAMGSEQVVSSGLKELGIYFTTNRGIANVYRWSKKREKTKEYKDKLEALEKKLDAVRNNFEFNYLAEQIELLTNGKIFEVFLNLRKIKTFDGEGQDGVSAYDNLVVDAGYDIKRNREAMHFLNIGWRHENIYKPGWVTIDKVDGIKAENVVELSESSDKYLWEKKDYIGDTYLVFPNKDGEFNNIKLADGSNTTFDENNSDIRFNDGGKVEGLKSAMSKINTLKDKKYKCSTFGECVKAADEVTDILDKHGIDYKVIEGYVQTNKEHESEYNGKKTKYRKDSNHTWVELKNGEKIDVSISQFENEGGIREYLGKDTELPPKNVWSKKEYQEIKIKENLKEKPKYVNGGEVKWFKGELSFLNW